MFFKVLKFYFYYSVAAGGDDDNPSADGQTDPTTTVTTPSPEEVIDIKTNYVKKEDYNKVLEDYRKLTSAILDGGDLPTNPDGEEGSDIATLRKELYDPNASLTNLDYVSKTLELREKIIKETGKDPFLPTGINGDPFKTDAERDAAIASAEKVAKVLGDAVKEANGDPEVFDIILSKVIV